MKVWLKAALPLIAVSAAGGLASKSPAASVAGRASTVLEWFDSADEDTAIPVYQYLNFNAKNIAGKQWNFGFYGRISTDLTDEVDADSRLYYANLEKRDLLKNLDLKLGRQFISTTAGASLMDGAAIDYRDLGPFKLSLFGGGDNSYYGDYSADDLIFGGEIAADLFKALDLGLSYVQKRDNGDVSHEFVGLDADVEFLQINVFNETQYSLLTEEVTYSLWGAGYYPDAPWSLRAEYLYSLPVFSSTSIYSVFAVDEYKEAMLEGNYRIRNDLRAFVRYTRELYEDVDDADVVEAGLEKFRSAKFSGYVSGICRQDEDGQDLMGVKTHGAYLFTPKFEAGAGVHVDVLERDLGFLGDENGRDDDTTTSQRIWVDATAHITPRVNIQGKFEYAESDLWDNYQHGRIRLNILF